MADGAVPKDRRHAAPGRTFYGNMPLLYYCRGDNHRRDLEHGVGYHLNQANPLLHEAALGDSVWAFTRAPGGAYALAAELVLSAKPRNPPGYRYGSCRVWGDLRRSRDFAVGGQPDITPLVRSLAPSRPAATCSGGRSRAAPPCDGWRRPTTRGSRPMARHPAPEPRARLLPEERLEALLASGDEAAVGRLL